jgi:hypothetical protein
MKKSVWAFVAFISMVLQTDATAAAPSSRAPVLTTIKTLAELEVPSKKNTEEILQVVLTNKPGNTNRHFDVYVMRDQSPQWRSVEVRIPKARGGALVLLELENSKIMPSQIAEFFGTPKEPLNQNAMVHVVQTHTISWRFSIKNFLQSAAITYGR